MLLRILVASIIAMSCVGAARATIFEVTYSGSTFTPAGTDASFDNQNLFGGGNLANKVISVTFTYDTSLAAIQNNTIQGNNAIAGAVTEVEITIGGISKAIFLPISASRILNFNDNLDSSRAQAEATTNGFNITTQLAENILGSATGAFIPRSLTTPYSFTAADGVGTGFFRFTDDGGIVTQALFTPTQVSMAEVAAVPGPTVGAGASSFALAALLLGWLVRRRRENQFA